MQVKHDTVNNPSHYTQHAIECIEIRRHLHSGIADAFKYVWRYKEKNGAEDLDKAIWYLDDVIKNVDLIEFIGYEDHNHQYFIFNNFEYLESKVLIAILNFQSTKEVKFLKQARTMLSNMTKLIKETK